MKIAEVLTAKVGEISRRYRSVYTVKTVVTFLCYGLSAYLALSILDKFIPLPLNWPTLLLTICGLSVTIGLVVGRSRPIVPFRVTCQIDQKLGLKEKVSTAWEYKDQKTSNELVPLLVRDAVRQLQGIKGKRVFPYQWLKKGKYLVYLSVGILLVPLLSYLVIPSLPLKNGDMAASLQEKGQLLMELANKVTRKEQLRHLRRASRLASQMRQIGEDFSYQKLKKEQVLQAYNSLQKEIARSLETTRGELLRELRVLMNQGKWGSFDEERLSELKKALQKEDYERISHLLPKRSMREGADLSRLLGYLNELKALKMMRKPLKESYERLKESTFKEGDGERVGTVTSKEKKNLVPEGDEKPRGYGRVAHEDSAGDEGLTTGYSSLPGKSSVFETQDNDVLEFDERGNLVKVGSQFDQGSFLMSLLRSISGSSNESGSSTEQALASYRELVMNKLAGEKIPLSYKEQIKKYFSSLEPE